MWGPYENKQRSDEESQSLSASLSPSLSPSPSPSPSPSLTLSSLNLSSDQVRVRVLVTKSSRTSGARLLTSWLILSFLISRNTSKLDPSSSTLFAHNEKMILDVQCIFFRIYQNLFVWATHADTNARRKIDSARHDWRKETYSVQRVQFLLRHETWSWNYSKIWIVYWRREKEDQDGR